MDRNVLLLHGTTAARARRIAGSQTFAPTKTYFLLGFGQRDLARVFARRAAGKWPREGGPALVLVSVPGSVVDRLRALRLLRMEGFDPGDNPLLVNRRQWVLEPGGVELLNRGMNEARTTARPESAEFQEQSEFTDLISQLAEMWRAQPKDVQNLIIGHLRQLWTISPGLLPAVVSTVVRLSLGGLPLPSAVRRAGISHHLRPRVARPPYKGPTTRQIREYHRRQQAIGRRPGREARLRRR